MSCWIYRCILQYVLIWNWNSLQADDQSDMSHVPSQVSSRCSEVPTIARKLWVFPYKWYNFGYSSSSFPTLFFLHFHERIYFLLVCGDRPWDLAFFGSTEKNSVGSHCLNHAWLMQKAAFSVAYRHDEIKFMWKYGLIFNSTRVKRGLELSQFTLKKISLQEDELDHKHGLRFFCSF